MEMLGQLKDAATCLVLLVSADNSFMPEQSLPPKCGVIACNEAIEEKW